MKIPWSDKEVKRLKRLCDQGLPKPEIARRLNRGVASVRAKINILWGVKLPVECSDKVKNRIIHLYTVEKRGKKHIASLIGVNDGTISNWLSKWSVPSWDRRTIQKVAMGICGPTKGFSGRHHTLKSKKQTSASSVTAYENGRKMGVLKSRTYATIIGTVIGRWEVAYLQRLHEDGAVLPVIVRKRLKTPYGTYLPDFEFRDRYIEIKSPYTLRLSKQKSPDNKANVTQMQKIKYVSKRVKKVEIIVLTEAEAKRYFKRAQKQHGILL